MSEVRKIEALSETELRNVFVERLSQKMSKADWYYEYSDDHREWLGGTTEIHEIRKDLKLLSKLDGGLHEAKKLWGQHVPPHSVNEPDFFSNPKLLNTIFNGILIREDMPYLQKYFHDQQLIGNRFIAIESNPLTLPKDRLFGFPSAIEAKNFAYENNTLKLTYVVYPIAHVLKEMERVSEPEKGEVMKVIAQRLQDNLPEAKRSPGQEMSP